MPRFGPIAAVLCCLLLVPCASATTSPETTGARAIGDTLTVIMRPILSIPEQAIAGDSFTIEAKASSGTSGWAVSLLGPGGPYPLSVTNSTYSSSHERWFLTVSVPADVPELLCDLRVTASGGIDDTAKNAVMVRTTEPTDYYVVHITDTHLPTHLYYYQSGADSDTSEMEDLRTVIEDINVMNPAFVLLTGDVVNEGELEEFLDKRYYTKAKRILGEFEVPVYVCAGNHDVGGWDDSPPPDGTARRYWWKFFGWNHLYDPPSGDPLYTQNYSFDFGGAHFVSLESYDNYDRWRRQIYGNESFTSDQINWLVSDIAAAPPTAPVVAFYHMDFQDELDIAALGIDCALWGHVHHTSGQISSPPFNLSTDNVCDGARAMRLVRVSNGAVQPTQPIDAGTIGQNLRLEFDPANDGTNDEVTAAIINNQPEDFEQAVVRFVMPAASTPYEVDAGELVQTVVEGDIAYCTVRLPAPANDITGVTISPTGAGIEDHQAALALAAPPGPNPAASRATVSFSLSVPGHVRVDVYDISGRRVARLLDGPRTAGTHTASWDLTDDRGGHVASGVYLWRITANGSVLTARQVVLR
ncbi:MAG: T9SS type A sorting domain-containing protein [Candidatus Eisenbacteria bacterium]|nr:T9SS type A sorting domain-containing protein [Candidatus Eisenbacteria bacterium]